MVARSTQPGWYRPRTSPHTTERSMPSSTTRRVSVAGSLRTTAEEALGDTLAALAPAGHDPYPGAVSSLLSAPTLAEFRSLVGLLHLHGSRYAGHDRRQC